MKHINYLIIYFVFFFPLNVFANTVICDEHDKCSINLIDHSGKGEKFLYIKNRKIENKSFFTTVSYGSYLIQDSESKRYYLINNNFTDVNSDKIFSFKFVDGKFYNSYFIYLKARYSIRGNQEVSGAICKINSSIDIDSNEEDLFKSFSTEICSSDYDLSVQNRYIKSHDSKFLMESTNQEISEVEENDKKTLKNYKFYISSYIDKSKGKKIGLIYLGDYNLDMGNAQENLACFSNCNVFESTTPSFTGFDKLGYRLSISYKIKNNSINGFYIKGDKKISVSGDYDSETHKVSFESSNGSINFNGEITDGTLSGNLKTDKGHEKLKLYMRILPN